MPMRAAPKALCTGPSTGWTRGPAGLMLAARTAHAQHLLQRLLHGSEFIREYLAVVEGAPPQTEGVIDLPIGKADGATIRREVRADGKPRASLILRAGNPRGTQLAPTPAGHRPHPSDPRTSLRAGLPRSRRFSLRNRAGQPSRTLCPAQRAGAAAPSRDRGMDRAGKPPAIGTFGPAETGISTVYARVLSRASLSLPWKITTSRRMNSHFSSICCMRRLGRPYQR